MLEQQTGQGWWENLPEDVIGDIFYRLPVSSILSARAVCKSWKARLASSEFRRSYDLNCTRENAWLVMDHLTSKGSVISIYNTSLDRWFKLPFSWSWKVCDGAGGLLLLKKLQLNGNCRMFVVGNPISNNWKELPPLPVAGFAECMGMVQGEAANSYKVVVLVTDLGKVTPLVYDSKVGLWSAKKSKDIGMARFTPHVVCNGVIYGVNLSADYVFKYNVEINEFTDVEMPRKYTNKAFIVSWKGAIYMFEQHMIYFVRQADEFVRHSPLGVWVLDTDKWVLLSRSSWAYAVSDCVFWLDGDNVRLFTSDGGSSLMVTYNLAVADSWSITRTECPLLRIAAGVSMPLSFTAAP